MSLDLEKFIKSERQWRRPERIVHYQYQLRRAKKERRENDVEFWRYMLEINKD